MCGTVLWRDRAVTFIVTIWTKVYIQQEGNEIWIWSENFDQTGCEHARKHVFQDDGKYSVRNGEGIHNVIENWITGITLRGLGRTWTNMKSSKIESLVKALKKKYWAWCGSGSGHILEWKGVEKMQRKNYWAYFWIGVRSHERKTMLTYWHLLLMKIIDK